MGGSDILTWFQQLGYSTKEGWRDREDQAATLTQYISVRNRKPIRPVRETTIGSRLDVPPKPAWMDGAHCRDKDPESFFPSSGESPAEALKVCGGCPVRDDCLSHAKDHKETGVWGGVNFTWKYWTEGRDAA